MIEMLPRRATLPLVILLTACAGPAEVAPAAVADACEMTIECPATDCSLPPVETPVRRIAITVDDLPLATPGRFQTEEDRERVVRGICEQISAESLPVTGFVNMVHHEPNPTLMPIWQECGVRFGNHTWSHPRLRDIGLEAYLEDLQRGHDALLPWVDDGEAMTFRYPFLYQGFEPSERDAIRDHLLAQSVEIAPITVDSRDWLYSAGYTDALAAGDAELAELYRRNWLWDLQESTVIAESLSAELFDQPPPEILLIHANELTADYLHQYVAWLRERGYEFITLSEALAHPVYDVLPESTSPTGDSHWLRLRRSRMMEHTH